jgi:hypothetical protein
VFLRSLQRAGRKPRSLRGAPRPGKPVMRKHLVSHKPEDAAAGAEWLSLAADAVEITSEDAAQPIERALIGDDTHGWRAGEPGAQTIRLLFDQPQDVHRIYLSFVETTAARTQEFVLRWSQDGKAFREIIRQRWNFSPDGATRETEDYTVNLAGARVLELTIEPNISSRGDYASLQRLRIA